MAPLVSTPQPVTAGMAQGLINPGLRSAEARELLPVLELMRACYGGTKFMREMGEIFLPREISETPARYQHRLNATTSFNKLKEAVDAASAKPFKNLISVTGGDAEFQSWMEDADLEGRHLHLVAHNFFNTAVLLSRSHILVDSPTTADLPNLAAQRALKIRPFMREIRPEDLLACYSERHGGVKRVVHARIASERRELDRRSFREVIYDQVFVIELGVVQLWERPRAGLYGAESIATLGQGGSVTPSQPFRFDYVPVEVGATWRLVGEAPFDLDEVPLVTMGTGDHPIFQDLAYKQIEHWRSSSEQRNILTASRFPMLACSGVNLETEVGADGKPAFEIGPWKIMASPDPNGRWYFIEASGNAVEAGRKDLEAIEMQMEQLSLNPIINQPGRQYVAQNERSITEERVNTVIHDLAITGKDALEQAIIFMGKWSGKDLTNVALNMNFDFSGTDEEATKITAILEAAKSKTLSRRGALSELKRLSLLSGEFDIEAEMKAADHEMADPAPPPAIRDFPGGSDRPTKQV